ncbi:hypothetical protein MTP99_001996 [Tenebrio molitor]|nr:hypothetical protein MTP99_001996 [Tenebrio molitor]
MIVKGQINKKRTKRRGCVQTSDLITSNGPKASPEKLDNGVIRQGLDLRLHFSRRQYTLEESAPPDPCKYKSIKSNRDDNHFLFSPISRLFRSDDGPYK